MKLNRVEQLNNVSTCIERVTIASYLNVSRSYYNKYVGTVTPTDTDTDTILAKRVALP